MHCSHSPLARRILLIATLVLSPWPTACDYSIGFSPGGWEIDFSEVAVNLTGTVTAAADGAPLAGVTIQPAYAWGVRVWGTDVTDAHGNYSMTVEVNCFETNCRGPDILAYPEGQERAFEPQSMEVGQMDPSKPVNHTTLDFSLRPARPITVTVHGQVTEATGGAIEGALITVRDRWAHIINMPIDSTFTDAEGNYSIAVADHCGMIGDNCLVSFRVRVQKDHQLKTRNFDGLNVVSDSLMVLATFTSLN